MTPDTSMQKVARLGSTTRFWFAAPGVIAESGGLPVFPAVTFTKADGTSIAVSMTPQFADLPITAAPYRDRLTLSSAYVGPAPTFGWGDAHIYSPTAGTIPVRVASVNGTTVQLVDRLPYDLAVVSGTFMQSALWSTVEGPGAPLDEVTRRDDGDFPVVIEVVWTLRNAALSATVETDRGTLSVVRQPFGTGLTTGTLRRLYPELGAMQQQGSAGFEAAIARTALALAMQVRADVREAGAPGYTWEDDLDGSPFLAAHAAMAAAAAQEPTDPESAARLTEQAKGLYLSALRSAWLDRNRSGTVQAGESPGLVGGATAAQVAPSVVPYLAPGWTMGERR